MITCRPPVVSPVRLRARAGGAASSAGPEVAPGAAAGLVPPSLPSAGGAGADAAASLGVPQPRPFALTVVDGGLEERDGGTRCQDCGNVRALIDGWCRECHPARCPGFNLDGRRCRAVGFCRRHGGR